MRKSSRNWRPYVGIIGLILSTIGILCGIFWHQICDNILKREMTLRPGSVVYEKWKNPPVSLSLDIYMYNWTNSVDFKNLSTKPILEQCGPYRFTERPDKVDIDWHPENSSVTYRKRSVYHFDAAGSKGSLDDRLINLNIVALAASKTKQLSRWVNIGLTMNQQKLTVSKSVDELLFTGYRDTMLLMGRTMSILGKQFVVPVDKFGWFYKRNGSTDATGVFNVYTGAEDASRIGQMHTWNYEKHSGFFDAYCGQVNGSGGEFYPPNLTTESVVQLFSNDMCRAVPLDYTDTVEVEGIRGYKYAGGARALDNGTLFPENSCFCGGQCVPSGVMNVSSCRYGSPAFMSFPHFYQADPYYVNQVVGLKPNKDEHEFYMILEPRTGVSLEVAARFQVNMLVEPMKAVRLYDGVPRIFFPMLWFEQKVRITPELAVKLKLLLRVLAAGQLIAGVLIAIGLVMLGWYPMQQLCLLGRHRKSIKIQSSGSSHYSYKGTDGKLIVLKQLQTEVPAKISIDETPDQTPLGGKA